MTDHFFVLYNAQRLFRPKGSRIARSLDFTTSKGWNSETYKLKVDAIGATLADTTNGVRPGLLVLCEVEDRKVVTDVLASAGWSKMVNVVVPGEKIDGYDVAIAYDPDLFKKGIVTSKSYIFTNRYSTRDLLSVTLSIGGGQTLTVFATHWASRVLSEGIFLRLAAADYCSRIIESQLKFPKDELIASDGKVKMPSRQMLGDRWWNRVLIAGDFNDTPWDSSLRNLLRSTLDPLQVMQEPRLPKGHGLDSAATYLSLRPRLYNPSWQILRDNGVRGTCVFDDEWNMLDQILFSAGMLRETGPRFVDGSLRIHAPRTVKSRLGRNITVTTKSGAPIRFDVRTCDGVSDHLPLIATLAFD